MNVAVILLCGGNKKLNNEILIWQRNLLIIFLRNLTKEQNDNQTW